MNPMIVLVLYSVPPPFQLCRDALQLVAMSEEKKVTQQCCANGPSLNSLC